MTKRYIDADIVIAEIDRLYKVNSGFKKEYRFHPFKRIVVGRLQALEGLKSFISSLPTEKEPSCQNCTNDKGCVTCKDGELWEGKEQPSEDLEKYASRAGFDYVDDIESKYPGHIWNDHDVEFAYRDGIIAGAEWQKEQILQLAKNRYEMAMTFVSGNLDVDHALQMDRLALVKIIEEDKK